MKKASIVKSVLVALALLTAGCSTDQTVQHPVPTYNTNGSFDDNGVAPVPNNGNQNFGRRW